MKPNLLPLADALRLAVSLSGRRIADVREELRQALLDGVVHAEGNVNPQMGFPDWGPIGRAFWTAMPDWTGNSAMSSSKDTATEIHVARADIQRLFDPVMKQASAAEPTGRPALWRLGGIEKKPTSDRGWLLPDAMREFFPSDYERWHAAAFSTKPSLDDSRDELALLGVVFDALRDALRKGELIATGISKGGEATNIPATRWKNLTGRSLLEFSMSIFDDAGRRYTDVRVREKRSSRSSVRTERRCGEWFAAQVSAGHNPSSRDAMLEQARREVDPHLTERAFLRIWEKTAPESWKRAGSKKGNRRT